MSDKRQAILAAVLVTGAIGITIYCAIAQPHHHHHPLHVHYQNWVNGLGQGCCNNADCAPVDDGDLRTTKGTLELFVRGVGSAKGQSGWCPILSHHYLKQGNAPDWSSAHACITQHYGATTLCAQLICFQPKPAG